MIKNHYFKHDFPSAVFKCDKTKLVLVQVRSSVSKAGKASFVDDLLGWAAASGLDKVVVLSSLAADERVDCQMAAAFRFLANHKCQAIKEALLQTGIARCLVLGLKGSELSITHSEFNVGRQSE